MRGVTRASAAMALAVVFISVGVSTAHAQTREADAERLFREGQKLMEERRYGEACPKFEAAYKKDGALGTLINLAFCHKEQGANWYSWLEFREAEVKATELNRNDRRDFAHARLAELEKGLPKVVIDNPQKVPLTEVLVEDRKVWEAERGALFAAEGGQRKFTFRAKRKKQATAIIMVSRGDRAQHVPVPDMQDATADDVPPPAIVPVDPPKRDVVSPPPPPASSAQRTIGWVAIGAGASAAVLGTVMGAIAIFGVCGHRECQGGARDDASKIALTSTVSYTVAGVVLVGGLVLLLTAPPPTKAASSEEQRVQRSAGGPRATRVMLAPSVGPTWAGISGTF